MGNWTLSALATAYAALEPAPTSLAAAAAMLNAQMQPSIADTTFISILGILYARQSWNRVQQIATGALTVAQGSLASGATSGQVQAICQMLVDGARPPGLPLTMSNPAINAAVQTDLRILADTKLSDTKGIIWAAGELASGDPGDSQILLAELTNIQTPIWSPAITIGVLQTAGISL